MKHSDKIIIIIFLLCAVSLFPANKKAPSFALFALNGELVTLKQELQKNNTLIVFFASYCAPCRKEIPDLVKLKEKYPDKFNLLFINIDKEGTVKAEAVLNELKVKGYPCLLDIYQNTIKKYTTAMSIPAFFFISRKGDIKFESIGYKEESISVFEKILLLE